VDLRAGETLIEAGAPAGFVYVPMADFLRGRPLGDYADFTLGSFTLVGLTGVVRGAARNADVFAGADMSLLAIPKAVFLEHWYFTYTPETLARALNPAPAAPR
jgi:CRP-like cAMP-binding protein